MIIYINYELINDEFLIIMRRLLNEWIIDDKKYMYVGEQLTYSE